MINLKKITPLAILFSVIIFSNCFAMFGYGEIPKSEVALGGLQVGATEDRVRSIYGEPDDVEYDGIPMGGIHPVPIKTLKYGKGFEITLIERQGSYTLLYLNVTANNGIKTPAGFTVGSNFSDVKKHYERVGKPDSSGGKIGEKSTRNGNTSYKYYSSGVSLTFEINSKNKVVGIYVVEILH